MSASRAMSLRWVGGRQEVEASSQRPPSLAWDPPPPAPWFPLFISCQHLAVGFCPQNNPQTWFLTPSLHLPHVDSGTAAGALNGVHSSPALSQGPASRTQPHLPDFRPSPGWNRVFPGTPASLTPHEMRMRQAPQGGHATPVPSPSSQPSS